ncbi:MAG: flagellar biosynthesis protein FlhF [Candidatus Manganitrophaceae bacterium]
MRIKKYEVFEIKEALQAIKKEMGPEAMILSTREIRKGGFGLFSRPMIEVTAAVDPPSLMGPGVKDQRAESSVGRGEVPTGSAGGGGMVAHPAQEQAEEGAEAFDALLEESGRRGESGPEIGFIREELRVIRESIEALRIGARHAVPIPEMHQRNFSDLHPTLTTLSERLILNGVDREVVDDLIGVMRKRLRTEDLWKGDFVENYLKEMIKGIVQAPMAGVTGRFPLPGRQKERDSGRVVALVGPTGVGKTTTLAKIAAHQFRRKRKVTLATLDTYRVGAIEQLKIYSKIIGAPVVVAEGPLRERLARRGEGEWIFIDTAGRSHLDAARIEELRALVRFDVPVETHLVVSSNTRPSDLTEIVDRFSTIPIDYFLFTKTDETRNHGSLLTALRKKGKPLSYLTTGQRVPEDIEIATPKRIADLVMG